MTRTQQLDAFLRDFFPGQDYVLITVARNGETELHASTSPREAKQVIQHLAEHWVPESVDIIMGAPKHG